MSRYNQEVVVTLNDGTKQTHRYYESCRADGGVLRIYTDNVGETCYPLTSIIRWEIKS